MRPRVAFLAWFAVLPGCDACGPAPAPDDGGAADGGGAAEGEMVVELLVDVDGISVLHTYAAPGPLLPGVDAPGLDVELRAGDAVLATTSMADPRRLRSEIVVDGGWDRRDTTSAFGVARVRLPARAGALHVRAGDDELGVVDVEPPAAQPLLALPDDVVGSETLWTPTVAGRSLHIVILSEGFTADQLDDYRAAAQRMVDLLLTRADFAEHAGRFRVTRVDVVSRGSGIDDPDAGTNPDTAFDVAYGVGDLRRAAFIKTAEALAATSSITAPLGADVVALVANSTEHAGAAVAPIMVTTRISHAPEIFLHELGHAAFGLADEYDYGRTAAECEASTPSAPNVANASARDALPWRALVDEDVPLPTPEDEGGPYAARVGAFEGAEYCLAGRFRPMNHCAMQQSQGNELCAVCRCALRRTFCFLDQELECTVESTCTERDGGPDVVDPPCTSEIGGAVSATVPCEPPYVLDLPPDGATDPLPIFVWAPSDPAAPAFGVSSIGVSFTFPALPPLNEPLGWDDVEEGSITVGTTGGGTLMAYEGFAEPEPIGTVEIVFETLTCTSGVCDVHGRIEAELVDPGGVAPSAPFTSTF